MLKKLNHLSYIKHFFWEKLYCREVELVQHVFQICLCVPTMLMVFCCIPSLLVFPGGSDGQESACMQETWVWSLGQEDPLEKGMATHSSILTWRIPWTEEPNWWATVHGVAKSWTRLKWLSMHRFTYYFHDCCPAFKSRIHNLFLF